MSRHASFRVWVRVEPDGPTLTLIGRDAWALQKLIEAGDAGVTPLDTPGPRWSGYVHKLRRAGLVLRQSMKAMAVRFPALMHGMCCGRM